MKQGIFIGVGIVLGVLVIGILWRLALFGLIRLVRWLDRLEEAHMTPEEKLAKKCRAMAEALRRHR